MELRSPEFVQGAAIPKRFTCAGEDVSPKLEWTGVPQEAEELLLIVEDPDAPAGVWTHWVLSGLDPARTGLDEGEVPPGTVEGINDFDRIGYGGPCPPVGHGPHRYFFTLYALSSPTRLTEGGTAEQARQAVQGNVLEEAELMGTFERRG